MFIIHACDRSLCPCHPQVMTFSTFVNKVPDAAWRVNSHAFGAIVDKVDADASNAAFLSSSFLPSGSSIYVFVTSRGRWWHFLPVCAILWCGAMCNGHGEDGSVDLLVITSEIDQHPGPPRQFGLLEWIQTWSSLAQRIYQAIWGDTTFDQCSRMCSMMDQVSKRCSMISVIYLYSLSNTLSNQTIQILSYPIK